MYEEIPNWNCWVKERLVPADAGFMCLKRLIHNLNTDNVEESEYELRVYALGVDADTTTHRCKVGECLATSEIDPLRILADWSKRR